MADELIAASRDHSLRFEWKAGISTISVLDARSGETIQAAMPRSAARAILARIAVRCNEHVPQSVSPYGGEAVIAEPRGTVVKVQIVNTADDQVATLLGGALDAMEKCNPLGVDERLGLDLPRVDSSQRP